ncbi:type II secretion system F family protein [Corynebacterium alimapuense]|uniref:Type II secretion protein F n=1 Tax=Corynebacterium alimapuense TaxID=1576874 RepID=A0A3M8K812_9CORY|nr:type II secretion system F family protein [Corynebacterium alimapuense]RNE49009.1 type II secretion protein F [Corynebacterium alimapuense]
MSSLVLLSMAAAIFLPSPAGRVLVSSPGPRIYLWLPAIVGLGAGSFLIIGKLSVVLAAVIAAGTAAWTLRDIRARASSKRREAAAAAFLGHLSGQLRAGSTIATAVVRAAEEVPESAPAEFSAAVAVVAAQARRGGSAAATLLEESTTAPELAGLGRLWGLADRHGLPLAPLVEQAQSGIDVRVRHRNAISATLQGPQASAITLTLLPVAGIAMGSAMGADPLGLLLGGGLGGVLLVLGLSLVCTGFIWSRKIIGKAAQ